MGKAERNGKKKKWPIAVGLGCVVLVGAGAACVKMGVIPKKSKTSEEALQTVRAEKGRIEVLTEGSGTIEPASTKAITLEYDGKLSSVLVETGDQVKPGDILAEYDKEALDKVIDQKEKELQELENQIANTDSSASSSINAPVDGRVKRIYADENDDVVRICEKSGGLAEICANGKLKIEISLDGSRVKLGEKVKVRFDDHKEDGTVTDISDGKVIVEIDDDEDYELEMTAKVYDEENQLIGSGSLQSSQPYQVRFSYGTIDYVNVSEGDYVYKGNQMFSLENESFSQAYLDLLNDREELLREVQELKDYRESPYVLSDSEGFLDSIDVIEGMVYEKDQQFGTVADTTSLNLKIAIDELDIDGVEVGQTANVIFDAFEEETYHGVVEKISGVGNNNGGVTTYTVTLAMEGNTHLKDGMSATANIIVAEAENVVLIPVDALKTANGVKTVSIFDGTKVQEVEVTTGLINNEQVEIVSGLSEGETVVLNEKAAVNTVEQMMHRFGQNGEDSGNDSSNRY